MQQSIDSQDRRPAPHAASIDPTKVAVRRKPPGISPPVALPNTGRLVPLGYKVSGPRLLLRNAMLAMLCASALSVAAICPVFAEAQEPAPPTFHADILPILKQSCLRCHNAKKKDGRLDLSTLQSLLKGGTSGPPLVPGDSKKSLMVDMIFFGEMPPKKEQPRVSKEDLKKIEAWIDAGALEGEMPADSK